MRRRRRAAAALPVALLGPFLPHGQGTCKGFTFLDGGGAAEGFTLASDEYWVYLKTVGDLFKEDRWVTYLRAEGSGGGDAAAAAARAADAAAAAACDDGGDGGLSGTTGIEHEGSR
eukprot:gene30052-23722_t